MTTEQIIEEIKNLKEIDFATVVEAVFDRAILENMDHIILHDELIEAGDNLDKYAFREQCSELEIERLTKIIEDIKELVK